MDEAGSLDEAGLRDAAGLRRGGLEQRLKAEPDEPDKSQKPAKGAPKALRASISLHKGGHA